MTFCNCVVGQLCPKCEPLSKKALAFAQKGGVAGAQQLYYEKMEELKRLEECRELLGLSKEDELEMIAVIPAPTKGTGLCRVCNKTVVKLPLLECVECSKKNYLDILHETPANLREYEDWDRRLQRARKLHEDALKSQGGK